MRDGGGQIRLRPSPVKEGDIVSPVDQPPGNCEISTATEVERKLTFVLEPDQVRYVKLNISMGFFVGHVYGELVDAAKAESEIAGTRYTGPPLARP